MNWRRTTAMARKEGLHIMRDRNSMVMALAMPVVFIIIERFIELIFGVRQHVPESV